MRRNWPLIPVILVVVIAIIAEPVVALNPQLLAAPQLKVAGQPATGSWSYTVFDTHEHIIGQGTAQVTSAQGGWSVVTSSEITSTISASAIPYDKRNEQAAWSSGLAVTSGQISVTEASGVFNYTVGMTNGQLQVMPGGGSGTTVSLPADALLPGEWPWRISGLAFNTLSAWRVDLIELQAGNVTTVTVKGMQGKPILQVQGAEPLAVPAGNYIAWRVTLGERTAWYDAESPHTLLRYDDGKISLRLAKP